MTRKFTFLIMALFTLISGPGWGQNTYTKATSLQVGDEVVLVCETAGMEMTGISTTSTKYGIGTAYTDSPAGTHTFTVVAGSESGSFSFKIGDNYLRWNSGNSLDEIATSVAKNSSWTIDFDDSGNATILNCNDDSRQILWNKSSPRFACYTGQSVGNSYYAVQFYKKQSTPQLELVSLAISGTPAKTEYEAGEEFDPAGLIVTGTYSDNSTAEITSGITWDVTPSPLTAGITSVSVTATVGNVTSPAYTVNGLTVNEHIVTPGTYTLGTDWNTLFGTSYAGSFNPSANSLNLNGTSNDIILNVTNGTSTNGYIKTEDFRWYNGYTLTFSVPQGYVITNMTFTKGGKNPENLTTETGSFNYNSESQVSTWNGSFQSVTFTATGTGGVSAIQVTYAMPSSVATPTFSPAAGIYDEPQNVTISCATENATIYYTTNGDEPTSSSTLYENPIPVSTTTTIKAIAYLNGEASNIATAEYEIVELYDIYCMSLPIDGGSVTTSPASKAAAGTDVTITVTPNEHYSFTANSLAVTGESLATIEVTPIPGEVIKYSFEMPAEDVTITAQFTEDPKYTVSYHANGSDSSEDVYAGEKQLAAPENVPNGYTYVGWTTAPIEGVAESATYFSSYNVTGNVDLYAVYATTTEESETTEYSFAILPDDFNGTSYNANNGSHNFTATCTTDDTKQMIIVCITNQVMKQDGTMQWQKNAGYIYNETDLGTIKSVVVNSSEGTFTTYYGTSVHPTSGTTVGNGFFTVQVGNATGKTSSVVVTFEQELQNTTYSNFCTTVIALFGNLAEATTEAGNAYYISGESSVPAGATATINGVLGNAIASLLIIEDGAQLIQYSDGVLATVEKNITGYGAENEQTRDGYYLIANPTERVQNDEYDALNGATQGYDLYTFDPTAELEWVNKVGTGSRSQFERTVGYLFASVEYRPMSFIGSLLSAGEPTSIDLVFYDGGEAGREFPGFNLVGNPYTCNAYPTDEDGNFMPFYKMNGAGSELELVENVEAIAPCQGFFVEANANGDKVTISTTAPEAPASMMSLTVSQNRGNVIDRAIVNFNGRNNLHKFMMNPAHTNISLAKNGEEFAAVSTSSTSGELPVNFKAEKNGTYTISVNTENVNAQYIHLIDNLTGADVDLLATPSYTFNASTSDYAYRFKLVFSMTGIEENGSNASSFAYISNGNLVIDNIEGEATMQIIDVLGRVISTETVNGSYNKALNLKAGLYIINLNGMTQKIVVE